MTNSDDTQNAKQAKPDWARIAGDALDIWQSQLTSLANDPKAKAEMARFVGPMSQMFVEWSNLMQQSMQGMAAYAGSDPFASSAAPESAAQEEPVAAKPAASSAETAFARAFAEAAAAAAPVATARPEPMPEALPSESLTHVEPESKLEPKSESVSRAEPTVVSEPSSGIVAASAAHALAELSAAASADSDYDDTPSFISAARGPSTPSDRARDLAELADRLAHLERELDGIRARKRHDPLDNDLVDTEDLQYLA